MVKKRKNKSVKINIHFSNRVLYTLIALGIIAILSTGVYAVLGTTPNPGHPVSQLQPCSANEILKMNVGGTAWDCATDVTGSSQWTTSGSNIYYNTGNVGIGTTSPGTYKLNVAGTASIGTTAGSTNQYLGINYGTDGSAYGAIRFYSGGTNTNTIHSFATAWDDDTLGKSAGAINIDGTNGVTIGVWDAPYVVFDDVNSRVGIGTASPGAKLEIEQTAGDGFLIGNRAGWFGASHMSIYDEHQHLMMDTNMHLPPSSYSGAAAGSKYMRFGYWTGSAGASGDIGMRSDGQFEIGGTSFSGNARNTVFGGDITVMGGSVSASSVNIPPMSAGVSYMLGNCYWKWTSTFQGSDVEYPIFGSPDCNQGDKVISCATQCDTSVLGSYCEDLLVQLTPAKMLTLTPNCIAMYHDITGGNEYGIKVGALCCKNAPGY